MASDSAEYQALTNPLIVSSIVPFLGKTDLLKCRLIGQLWNKEVVKVCPKRRDIYLSVGPYMDQLKVKGGTILPHDSVISNRLAISTNSCSNPKQLLDFCRHNRNGQEIKIHVADRMKEDSISWGRALLAVFTNDLCPFLTELTIISVGPYALADPDPMRSTCTSRFSLPNLKVLNIVNHFDDQFFLVVQKILNYSPNLEKLDLESHEFFPELTRNGNLKILSFSTTINPSAEISEVERMLNQVASNLESLQLCFRNTGSHSILFPEATMQFPEAGMPLLKSYVCQDLLFNPFPLVDGDFVRFLHDKLPLLENLEVLKYNIRQVHCDVFAKAIHRSSAAHNKLTTLRIPMPKNIPDLKEIKERFPEIQKAYLINNMRAHQMLMDVGYFEEFTNNLAEMGDRIRNLQIKYLGLSDVLQVITP